ncbi:type II secretion system protein GspM [Vibrio sp.]|uniref:type II secretion system protein GspM n=1 Tax=Vibrio sp. TaxID=678 RepID=UPI003D0DCF86
MRVLWNKLNQAFNQRLPREKWLISGCGLVVIIVSLQTFLIDPLLTRHQIQSNRLASLQSSNQGMQLAVQQLQHELSKDPDADIEIELTQLKAQHQQLSAQLDQVMENLVSPSQMAKVLREVLEKSQQLKLLRLTSLPAEPMGEQQDEYSSQYFIHPVRMELTGSYFAIYDYLAALEGLPVNYYWRRFHYQVVQYPQAKLILEIYTLSSRKEFIGG